MKILTTGFHGFTGYHIAAMGPKFHHEIVPMMSDLSDIAGMQSEIEETRPNAILHLAAKSFVNEKETSSFEKVNVAGTQNLLIAIDNTDVPLEKILIASSANIYGNANKSPIPEKAFANPVNEYAKSKVMMESNALSYAKKMPIIITRPFNYTGVNQDIKFLIPKIVSHFKQRKAVIELGNIDIEREFNDVRFVCESYLRLLEISKNNEIYNICTGKPHSISAIIDLLKQLTGHDIKVIKSEEFVRETDIASLYGNPDKLYKTVPKLHKYTIEETLTWMLNH